MINGLSCIDTSGQMRLGNEFARKVDGRSLAVEPAVAAHLEKKRTRRSIRWRGNLCSHYTDVNRYGYMSK